MQLGRFAIDEDPRIGLFEDDTVVDVTDAFDDFGAALETVTDGGAVPDEGDTFSRDEIHHLPPTTRENTVFCLALNYRSHADEAGRGIPERPMVFMKLYRSLVGHGEDIEHDPSVAEEFDYEAELAAIIGKSARHVSEEAALDHVAGYTILNDISARDLQLGLDAGDRSFVDWFSGKAMQRSSPAGPYVTTSDEVSDPQDLQITSRLNGEVMQDESSGLMIRGVAELVSHISTKVELEPGDVIATGTPEGVGTFQDVVLEDGDTVEITIEKLGTLSNQVRRIE